MPKIFDSHAHLSSICIADSVDLLKNSNYFALNVTTHRHEWQPSVEFQTANNNIFNALGLHPWFVNSNWSDDLVYLKEMIKKNPTCSIGEIGLDYFPDFIENKDVQLKAFLGQLDLAEEYGLAVSLHCRKAFDDLYLSLKGRNIKGVLHGFSSSNVLAKQFIKLGFKIGIGRLILNPNNRKLAETVKDISLNDMVIESDFINLKSNNQTLTIEELYLLVKKIAFLKGLPILEVEETLYNNAITLIQK